MPYKFTLTLLGGQKADLPEIHHNATPPVGTIVFVGYPGGAAKAKVTGVRTFPSRSPETAVQTVDQVDAQEL